MERDAGSQLIAKVLGRERQIGSLVGRSHELAVLERELAQAIAGEGRFVLLLGEAGIGKTTLAKALVEHGRSANVRVAVARGWEGAGAPPWWIWKEALRSVGERLALSPTLTHDEARFACLESIVDAVNDLCADGRPLILVLDDLQWADVGSLLAVKLLARSMANLPLLLIGTARLEEQKEDAGVLADLRREATCISLPPFDRSQVMEIVSGHHLEPESIVDRTLAISSGNPLFVVQLLADDESRRALVEGRQPPIPSGVGQLLRRQLERLDPQARKLIEWASVTGDPIDPSIIVAASEAARKDVLEALARAQDAGIVVPAGSDGPLHTFVHGLLRNTTYAGIERSRRETMHAAIARVLMERVDTEVIVADHLLLASPDGSEEAITHARRAAKVAIARMAYEKAVALADRVVAAEERRGRIGDLAMALALRAEAKMLAGNVAGSVADAERALDAARDIDAPEPYARAALARGLRRTMGMPDQALVRALEEALARLVKSGRDDPALRCAIEARLGSALQPLVDPPRALSLARHAIETARSCGDEALLARTIHEARPAFRLLEPLEERLGLDRTLRDLGERLGDANLAAHAHGRLFWLSIEGGDAISAGLHLAEYERLATRTKLVTHEWGAALARATRMGMSGDWEEADSILDRLEQTRDRWESAIASHLPMDGIALLRARHGVHRGDFAGMGRVLATIPLAVRPIFEVWFAALQGHVEKAAPGLDAVMGRLPERDAPFAFRVILAEAAVMLRKADHAKRLFQLLEAWSGRHLVGTPMPAYQGSADRLLAGLAALQGDKARAQKLYDAALHAELSLGATVFAEQTRREREALVGPSPAPVGPPSKPEPTHRVTLEHEGDSWIVRFEHEEARIRDVAGLHYVAYLVGHPGVPVAAIELFAMRGHAMSGEAPSRSDAGPILDSRAVGAYRARASELRERLEEALAHNDLGRAEAIRADLDFIEDELKAAIGLGGRARKLGSESERVRVNVTIRIRKAIEKLRDRAPRAAHHLATAIRTGTTCVYAPGPRD